MKKVRNFSFFASIICCVIMLVVEELEYPPNLIWVWAYIGLLFFTPLSFLFQIIIWVKKIIRWLNWHPLRGTERLLDELPDDQRWWQKGA